MKRIVIACSGNWLCRGDLQTLEGEFDITLIKKQEDLSISLLERVKPNYVFVPHWNWKISKPIIDTYRPIIFHTAPLPEGRGGSPIQNLILLGYKSAPVWALFATEKFDEGPLIIKRDISLEGNLSEILMKIKEAIIEMIPEICEGKFIPIEQGAGGLTFKRLKPEDNQIPNTANVQSVYDRIRMVDADGYPDGFIKYGNLKIEFSNASLKDGEVTATAKISTTKSKD